MGKRCIPKVSAVGSRAWSPAQGLRQWPITRQAEQPAPRPLPQQVEDCSRGITSPPFQAVPALGPSKQGVPYCPNQVMALEDRGAIQSCPHGQ